MAQSTQDDMMRGAAKLKSYTGAAVVTLILYLFLFIPGLIANILYLSDARRMQRIAGEKLPGVGCLNIMLILMVLAGAVGLLVMCVALSGGSK